MRKLLIISFLSISINIGLLAQEGRPALAAETTEDERVKTILRNAFPHNLADWEVEDESKTEGATWFHDGGMAVKYPFSHEFTISYKRQNVSSEEREKWQKIAVDEAGIRKMIGETQCEIKVYVNNFYYEFDTRSIQNKAISPFSLTFVGQYEAKLLMGNGWKNTKNEDLGDGRRNYVVEFPLNRTVPMTQIQCILIDFSGSPAVLDFLLKNTDLKAINALVGQNKMVASAPTTANQITEKPLVKPIAGNNEIEFTLDGGDFQARKFQLKHSALGEFGYLNNNHPDKNITENAITRILISEDDDFKTKNKTGFLDITIPFIRQTGEFTVVPGAEKASFAGGINCWDGCEYSFDAIEVQLNITRYDPVGGFIEGIFKGEVKVGYKINLPLDNTDKEKPNAQIMGHFKVRRKADRY